MINISNPRDKLIVKVGRKIQNLPLHHFRAFESLMIKKPNHKNTDIPIIFILSPPRSGSTLIYQSIVHSIQPLYVDNTINLFSEIPYFGSKLSSKLNNEYISDFNSTYGFINGLNGPAEGLKFWSYWTNSFLNESENICGEKLKKSKKFIYLRKVLNALTSNSKPFLAGYLGHVLVIDMLKDLFPSCIFIKLRRDKLSNAYSIMNAMNTLSRKDWFSVLPLECEKYKNKDIYKKAASQVYWLNKRIENQVPKEKSISIDYEKFCLEPNQTMNNIVLRLNSMGLNINIKNKLPKYFNYRLINDNSSSNAQKISKEFRVLEDYYGPIFN